MNIKYVEDQNPIKADVSHLTRSGKHFGIDFWVNRTNDLEAIERNADFSLNIPTKDDRLSLKKASNQFIFKLRPSYILIETDRIYWSMCIFLCSSWVLAASVLRTGAVAASQNNLFHQRRRRPSSSQQRSSILMKMSHTWAQHTHQVCLSLTGVLVSAVV